MTDTETADLGSRLRLKAAMLRLGERIAFGSDADALEDAADAIAKLTRERDEARAAFDAKTAAQIIVALQEADLRRKDRIAELTRERDEAREAALEEAAKVADARELHWSEDAEQSSSGAAAHIFRRKADAAEQIAAAIRALKEPTP
jgi:hypothetical protein